MVLACDWDGHIGFKLEGDAMLTCKTGGVWSAEAPKCAKVMFLGSEARPARSCSEIYKWHKENDGKVTSGAFWLLLGLDERSAVRVFYLGTHHLHMAFLHAIERNLQYG